MPMVGRGLGIRSMSRSSEGWSSVAHRTPTDNLPLLQLFPQETLAGKRTDIWLNQNFRCDPRAGYLSRGGNRRFPLYMRLQAYLLVDIPRMHLYPMA